MKIIKRKLAQITRKAIIIKSQRKEIYEAFTDLESRRKTKIHKTENSYIKGYLQGTKRKYEGSSAGPRKPKLAIDKNPNTLLAYLSRLIKRSPYLPETACSDLILK